MCLPDLQSLSWSAFVECDWPIRITGLYLSRSQADRFWNRDQVRELPKKAWALLPHLTSCFKPLGKGGALYFSSSSGCKATMSSFTGDLRCFFCLLGFMNFDGHLMSYSLSIYLQFTIRAHSILGTFPSAIFLVTIVAFLVVVIVKNVSSQETLSPLLFHARMLLRICHVFNPMLNPTGKNNSNGLCAPQMLHQKAQTEHQRLTETNLHNKNYAC